MKLERLTQLRPNPFLHKAFVRNMRRMTARMKDIAKDLDLSVVTISKVLRNHPDIADETRQRVLRRVKELDYQPNITRQKANCCLNIYRLL